MTDDRETSPERPTDLLGEIDASQRQMEAVVSVVDQGSPIDLIHYVAARARLDAAIAQWNLRASTT
ncbi:MAG: hypothetical protein K0S43_1498 [Cellulosimicrobium sp.]|jgi:hypothetical protein|uniref:Uncharacterized protein n=1 Tax=Cellulosimicrobium composti TaxID=2672572 RepID=A0ABX0BG17_9MICO|nr:hypothetical protein [Cellulosimicrobium composti]MDF2806552.1 hypothetical protein [Cellulosimicrobium sp.]NDO91449.1 hypothetical protein [Cellulosimicrobium composti]TWG82815.1 hypothetical protein L603_002800000480 [Cellulosimicrobium cellulans J34]SMF13366.1 hypothetical protein SAMN02744115_01610 [Cellulosimicrobium cellulans J1]